MAQTGQASLGALKGAAKLERVTKLVNQLSDDSRSRSLSSSDRESALEELKIYGREPINSDPIFTKKFKGIETLARQGFSGTTTSASHNALRCLANAMLLKPPTRQMFVDLGLDEEICSRLATGDLDDEFLVSRVIFYTTYQTSIDLVGLIERHHLARGIVDNLSRHATALTEGTDKTNPDPRQNLALAETLKLMYNVVHFCPAQADAFAQSIPHLVTLLCKSDLPAGKPLDPPTGLLVNAFINLNLDGSEAASALHSEKEADAFGARLLSILDAATKSYAESELEESVTPLILAINRLLEVAPEQEKKLLQSRLLPAEDDRRQVLGRGEGLPSWLLRNSTNPVAPSLRKAIASLLYDLSDQDASKLVQNVGYGYASGLLFQNGIPLPAGGLNAADGGAGERPVNPITGQFIDLESPVELPPMTDEEKEREAERLFVLFERLRGTGVVNVLNPVAVAQQEGRFEELEDDEVEKID